MLHRLLVPLLVAATTSWVFAAGCEPGDSARRDDDGSDADADSDSDGDGDSDSDGDPPTEPEPIPMDCSDCPSVGSSLANMACAIDLCDEGVVVNQSYDALTNFAAGDCTVDETYEAVTHFGTTSNDLAPQLNDSYALMACGPATGTFHSGWCDDWMSAIPDPWSDEGYYTYDVVEWRVTLEAPADAQSFRFKYVFFSEEYDEWISSEYNDKFYAILEAPSTNGGEPTIINFTECRDPDAYYDFVCDPGNPGCEEGGKYCYIAINSAFSECCWYPNGSDHAPNPGDPPCPDGTAFTDISGTGFECAPNVSADSYERGSSTGWLKTAWPIAGGETFSLTFHVHDTSDGRLDSEVILDAFEFLTGESQGTTPIE